jgi:hypothetical protein
MCKIKQLFIDFLFLGPSFLSDANKTEGRNLINDKYSAKTIFTKITNSRRVDFVEGCK